MVMISAGFLRQLDEFVRQQHALGRMLPAQ